MADVTTISAALVAVFGATSSLVSAAKNPGDLSKIRDEIKAVVASVATLAGELSAVRRQIDPELRDHLDALALRVEKAIARLDALEAWRIKRRDDLRASTSRDPSAQSGVLEAARSDHERRIIELEERERERDERIATIREVVAGVVANVEHVLTRKS